MRSPFIKIFLFVLLASISAFPQSTIWKLEVGNVASGVGANVGRSVSVFGGTGVIGIASTTWITTQYLYVYANTWAGGSGTKGFKLTANTQNFTNITISYSRASDDFNGTNIGPRDFKLQYSLDNVTYIDVPNGTESLVGGTSFDQCLTKTNLPLPAACNNAAAVYLRWIMTSNSGVSGKAITPVGESKLANIEIKGIEMPVAPTDITLNNNAIGPNTAIGSDVGTFSVVDFNSSDTYTLTLVGGAGASDNASFQITGATLKTAAALPIGTYSIRVNAFDGTYNFAKSFSITVAVLYPAINCTYQTWDYITNVSFNTIDHSSDGTGGGYKNLTGLSTAVNRLSTYTLSVTNPATSVIDPSFPEYIKAWIDWNGDGAFDETESYEVGGNLTEQQISSVPITVPGGAVLSDTRMRIVIWGTDNSQFPVHTGTVDYGEAQDYTIEVNAALPVELTSFTASAKADRITLNWKTATEANNHGFEIERCTAANDCRTMSVWKKIGFVQGQGTCSAPHEYRYTDTPAGGTCFKYRLKQIDADGKFEYSGVVEGTIDPPAVFAVRQNFPNPFNPATTIAYALPEKAFVTVAVFDAIGREVRTLVHREITAGYHEITFDGNDLSSGVYLYRIQAGELSRTGRMILQK